VKRVGDNLAVAHLDLRIEANLSLDPAALTPGTSTFSRRHRPRSISCWPAGGQRYGSQEYHPLFINALTLSRCGSRPESGGGLLHRQPGGFEGLDAVPGAVKLGDLIPLEADGVKVGHLDGQLAGCSLDNPADADEKPISVVAVILD
jgi:hypothetical protein